jgi:hypothetical protein
MKLLGTANTKTKKGEVLGYQTWIMHLAPSTLSGYQVCPMASPGCAAACLNMSGMGKFSNVQKARILKTKFFFEHRAAFLTQLIKELKVAIRKSTKKGFIPVFRLNGTSDIRWETIAVHHDNTWHDNIMHLFPQVQFFDYTKIPNRRNIPANYHLTFSRSEVNENIIPTDMNVAVVFDALPETYMGRMVIDGTKTDLRFLDPSNVVVGLVANGKAKKDTTGFTVLTQLRRAA